MAPIVLHGLRKVYPGKPPVVALDDLNLTVDDGELVAFVGPSGCGKSTVLRCVAGLEKLTAGRVLIGEREVQELPPGKRDVAMVFQNYALYPHLTVYKNLAFPLKERHVPKAKLDAEVRRVAEMLELTELLRRRPAQLSGGQRQRVAMGRALVREPLAFLLDEPLSNLDAKLRTQMRSEIAAVHRRLGITSIYVTHDQVEAMTLGERIVVLRDGKLQQVGPPAQVYEDPVNLFVAGFLGTPSMNLLEVRAERGVLVKGPLRLVVPGAPDGDVVLGIRRACTRRRPTTQVRFWTSSSRTSRRSGTRTWSTPGCLASRMARRHSSSARPRVSTRRLRSDCEFGSTLRSCCCSTLPARCASYCPGRSSPTSTETGRRPREPLLDRRSITSGHWPLARAGLEVAN